MHCKVANFYNTIHTITEKEFRKHYFIIIKNMIIHYSAFGVVFFHCCCFKEVMCLHFWRCLNPLHVQVSKVSKICAVYTVDPSDETNSPRINGSAFRPMKKDHQNLKHPQHRLFLWKPLSILISMHPKFP